jgi:type IX secretion system PorP/SprF family membrane protein
MRKIIITLFIFILGYTAYAQQQINYTQYMFNQLPLNPAYAGIHEGISASMLWREQWVGFEGAPSTQMISLHSPIAFRAISLGAVIMRDKIGVEKNINARFSYAYRLQLGKTKLSFGLDASFSQYATNFNLDAINDPVINSADQSFFKPNFGTGILWHSEKFYVGVGLPNAINQNYYDASGNDKALLRHYYFTGGYVFVPQENLIIKPNFMVKAVKGAPVQVDMNLNVLLQRVLWVGLSYRSFESIDAVLQFQVNPKMQIGYAFDFWTMTDLNSAHKGSHEFMLNYVFELPKTKIVTPRYF